MAQDSIKRKLTTILAADVAGYSRLMADDEEATLHTLRGHREIIDGLIDKYHGRIFNTAGDSVLAEFGSTVEAVRCAISIQEELPVQNAELAEERQMLFRIGVNVGDVMVEDDNLYGDGVNVAARLEGVAEPGGICISGSAFDQVKDRLSIGFEDMGPQEVKNIAQPIPAFRIVPGSVSVAATPARSKRWRLPTAAAALVVILIAGGLAVWQPWSTRVEAASEKNFALPLPDNPSIVVLPFANLSGNPEQNYVGDLITETITTALGRSPTIFVIARASARNYDPNEVSVHTVAEELGVQYVLRGSVATSGDTVRITANLFDALSGRQLWAERYEGGLKDDFFSFLDETTLSVIVALDVGIGQGQSNLGANIETKNLEAYQLVRRAIPQFLRLTKQDNAEARQLFQQAVDLDPNYALAWYFIGNTYMQSARFRWGSDPAADQEIAAEYARKAQAIDPDHSAPYNLFSQIALRERKYDEAIAHMERALSLHPNHEVFLTLWGRALTYAGRPDEGLPIIQQGIRRSPFASSLMLRLEGEAYHALGQYEEAIPAFKRARTRDPKSPVPVVWLLMSYADLGRAEEARATAQELFKLAPQFPVKRFVQGMEYKDRTEVEKRLASLRKLGMPELKLD
jgi:adenylate cyclase